MHCTEESNSDIVGTFPRRQALIRRTHMDSSPGELCQLNPSRYPLIEGRVVLRTELRMLYSISASGPSLFTGSSETTTYISSKTCIQSTTTYFDLF